MLQFNCADILNMHITNDRCFYPVAPYPMKRGPSLVVQPQDLASNAGFNAQL